MSRTMVFVPMLLMAGLVLAGEEPMSGNGVEAEKVAAPAEPEEKPVKEEAREEAETQAETPDQDETKVPAEEKAKDSEKDGLKVISGMSILGNQEAPKSLVIVPWKSSELGASIGIMPMLDDSRLPIDKEVFMRALSYYELRSAKTK